MSRRRHRASKMDIREAVAQADAADLPDGAWWATLMDLTGLDEGEIADEIAARPDMHERKTCCCLACIRYRESRKAEVKP